MLEPKKSKESDAIIMEFKVFDPEEEDTLKDTVQAALEQIGSKKYAALLWTGAFRRKISAAMVLRSRGKPY